MKCINNSSEITGNYLLRTLGAAVVCLCLLPISVPLIADTADDFDGDGVPDIRDRDQDNDGLLNSEEGFVSVSRNSLPVAMDFHYQAGDIDVDAGGSSASYKIIQQNTDYLWHGSAVSSVTDVSWADHGNLPKLQNQRPGVSTVLWTLRSEDRSVPINMDLTVSDLDVERSEAVIIEASMIVGYSLTAATTVDMNMTANGMIRFSAVRQGAESDSSVTLHIRDRDNLVIGYSSESGDATSVGSRAGFRHEFISGVQPLYAPVSKALDSDGDGAPDHRDTDSNDDGIADAVDSGLVLDSSELQVISVDTDGVPIRPAEPGVAPVTEPPTAGGSMVTQEDADGDGLTNSQESLLGSDPDVADTDGDGFGDADEIIVFHTDPVDDQSSPLITENETIDSDGDGISDSVETIDDTDADSLPNQFDLDSDNDGLPDVLEAGLPDADLDGLADIEQGDVVDQPDLLPDTDGDGAPDYLDLDSDEDGLFDRTESGFADDDENGVSDQLIDENNNGWEDPAETANRSLPDSNGNRIPDYLDADTGSNSNLPAVAAMQNDAEDNDTRDEALVTGVKGAGCTFDPHAKDSSMLLLLIFIIIIGRRRQLAYP